MTSQMRPWINCFLKLVALMKSFLSTIPVSIPSSSLLNTQQSSKAAYFYTLNAVQFIDLIFGPLDSLNAKVQEHYQTHYWINYQVIMSSF